VLAKNNYKAKRNLSGLGWVASGGPPGVTYSRVHQSFYGDVAMSWLVILFASIGAALILGALTFVSALIGVLVTAMIVLMCGPLIDRYLARRNRRAV
jgi:type IV secretory pathway VirB2 component (pilin)